MSDFANVLFRFGLPGFPMFFVFGLIFYSQIRNIFKPPEILAILSLFLVLFFGFLIQQIWYFWFDNSAWSYSSKYRPVLMKIKEIVKPETFRRSESTKPVADEEVYAFWESIIYSKKRDPEMLKKASRTWDYLHISGANAFGLYVGAVLSLVFSLFYNLGWFPSPLLWIGLIFSCFSILLWIKTKSTRLLIDNLEKNWASMWIKNNVALNSLDVMNQIPKPRLKRKQSRIVKKRK